VERHLDRLGGWRLAPQLLVDQLAVLQDSEPLVLVPRRQMRHPKSQLDFLGEAVDVILQPDDRPLPVWSTVRRWSFAARACDDQTVSNGSP
jgi:hypothetical protein